MLRFAGCAALAAFLWSTSSATAQLPSGFEPGAGNTIAVCPVPNSLSASSVSSNVALNDANNCGHSVILYNIGAQEAFYRIGTANTVMALVTDYSLPGNTFIVLSILEGQTYIAAITASSTTTIRVVQGTSR